MRLRLTPFTKVRSRASVASTKKSHRAPPLHLMPSGDDDAYEEEAYEEGGDDGKASGGAGASAPAGARLRFPDMPGVELPRAALRPPVVVVAREDENTVSVRRSSRGITALEERNAEPTAAQQALRDFSALHPVPVKKWQKALLNEVAYATSRCVQGGCDWGTVHCSPV